MRDRPPPGRELLMGRTVSSWPPSPSRSGRRMSLRALRYVALLLAALGLTMGAAHALELPPKMQYDPALYARVTSTLYALYGAVGGPIQVAALVAAWVLAYWTRGLPAFRLTLLGALGLTLSLALWAALVAPVNAAWGEVLATAPENTPAAYARLRPRWEYGHVAAFAAWLAGFSLLLGAALQRPASPST